MNYIRDDYIIIKLIFYNYKRKPLHLQIVANSELCTCTFYSAVRNKQKNSQLQRD